MLHHARLHHGLLLWHHALLLLLRHPHLLRLSHASCAQLPRLLLLDDGADPVHKAHLIVGYEAQVGFLFIGVEQDQDLNLAGTCTQ